MYKILIVEDEKPINDLISMNLSIAGYSYEKAYTGKEALEILKTTNVHLILLDVMLPEKDGFEVAGQINDIPIIFITAKSSITSKIKGFDLGAEDYIVKPFEVLELLARINVVIRNKYGKSSKIVLENVTVDLSERSVYKSGLEITLTKTEFDLLEMLIVHKNIALSREKLLEKVWGYDTECDTRTVDVYIQHLRKKLGWEDVIKTVYKYGYRLAVKK